MTTEKQHESFLDLIAEAEAMLNDRQPEEALLIYHIAKLPDDLRAGIIVAYQNMKGSDV